MRFFAFTVLFALTGAAAAAPIQRILTSARENIHLDQWELTSQRLDDYKGLPFSIRKTTLHGGKQEGVDLIEVDNGRLKFRVIPTRGMGVLDVTMDDVRLGWNSPVKEVVHPRHVNLHDRGGLGWLEGFNEWMVRCGLEFAGHPGTDKFINNTGSEAEMDLTLHGKIANIPASEVRVIVDREPPYKIRILGRVDEKMFYGPNLELWTEISTEPESNQFRIRDRIKNKGAFAQEFTLIYHANYGVPLLGKNARLVVAAEKVVPFNAHAARAIEEHARYTGPTLGFAEEVYCIWPKADEKGLVTILLQNPQADRGLTMQWPLEQLPYLTQWKNTAATASGYVTGLEPGTGFPHNRGYERRYGRVPKLEPGQRRVFEIVFSILDSADGITAAAERIREVQGDQAARLLAEPEE